MMIRRAADEFDQELCLNSYFDKSHKPDLKLKLGISTDCLEKMREFG